MSIKEVESDIDNFDLFGDQSTLFDCAILVKNRQKLFSLFSWCSAKKCLF